MCYTYIRSLVDVYEMQTEQRQDHDRKSRISIWILWLMHALSFLPNKTQAVPILHPARLSSWAFNDTP